MKLTTYTGEHLQGLTSEQIDNLNTLSLYLWNLPADYAQFHMGGFINNYSFRSRFQEDSYMLKAASELKNDCGTVACAVGHGPSAGISPRKGCDSGWLAYCERVFGIALHENAFDWMFGADWQCYDNSPHGAAQRIRVFLESGVPSDWDDQIRGDSPLSYENIVL